jgi:uncharacterized protein YqeY
MENLKQQIQSDLKEAMKSKDAFLLSVLRMVSSTIKNKEIDKRMKLMKGGEIEKIDELAQLTDEEIISVLLTEIKRRKDAALEYKNGNRPELAEKEAKEAELLIKYMPEQMSENEIRGLVVAAIQKIGASSPQDMGRVMSVLMVQVKGKADGALVQKIVKEELEK